MIKISTVSKGSQADVMGLLAGDIIYEVNKTKIDDPYHFLSELLKAESNGKLIVFRNNKPFYIELNVAQPLGVSFEDNLNKTKYKLNVSPMKVLSFNFLWVVILVILYGIGSLLRVENLFLSLGVLLYVFDAIKFIIDKLESTIE